MSPDAESMIMLTEAREKAASLVSMLLEQQAELDAAPLTVDPQALVNGRAAMDKAVAAARRTLASLDQALQLASTSSN